MRVLYNPTCRKESADVGYLLDDLKFLPFCLYLLLSDFSYRVFTVRAEPYWAIFFRAKDVKRVKKFQAGA